MKKYIISGVVALLILAAGGTALATIPDSGGVIHGCYKTSTGMLSVVDSPTATCPSGTTSLNWNQTGPQGPAGANGTNGVSGYEIVTRTVNEGPATDPSGNFFTEAVACPTGKRPISGSYANLTGGNPTALIVSSSIGDGSTGWTFTIKDADVTNTVTYQLDVLCATA